MCKNADNKVESSVNSDCEVCKQLMREKHRFDIIWKIACVLFAILAVVFAILFFTCRKPDKETTVNMDGAQIETSGDDNNIIIGGDNYAVS